MGKKKSKEDCLQTNDIEFKQSKKEIIHAERSRLFRNFEDHATIPESELDKPPSKIDFYDARRFLKSFYIKGVIINEDDFKTKRKLKNFISRKIKEKLKE